MTSIISAGRTILCDDADGKIHTHTHSRIKNSFIELGARPNRGLGTPNRGGTPLNHLKKPTTVTYVKE